MEVVVNAKWYIVYIKSLSTVRVHNAAIQRLHGAGWFAKEENLMNVSRRLFVEGAFVTASVFLQLARLRN